VLVGAISSFYFLGLLSFWGFLKEIWIMLLVLFNFLLFSWTLETSPFLFLFATFFLLTCTYHLELCIVSVISCGFWNFLFCFGILNLFIGLRWQQEHFFPAQEPVWIESKFIFLLTYGPESLAKVMTRREIFWLRTFPMSLHLAWVDWLLIWTFFFPFFL